MEEWAADLKNEGPRLCVERLHEAMAKDAATNGVRLQQLQKTIALLENILSDSSNKEFGKLLADCATGCADSSSAVEAALLLRKALATTAPPDAAEMLNKCREALSKLNVGAADFLKQVLAAAQSALAKETLFRKG